MHKVSKLEKSSILDIAVQKACETQNTTNLKKLIRLGLPVCDATMQSGIDYVLQYASYGSMTMNLLLRMFISEHRWEPS